MAKIIPYLTFLCGCIIVIFLMDFIEGRGILKRKQSSKEVQNVDDSVGILLKERDERLPSANIKGPRCETPECKHGTSENKHRHRHGQKKKPQKKKNGKKNSKKRRKNRRRKNEKRQKTTVVIEPEDVMQRGEAPADDYDQASYDQYYAGAYGRKFGRLQRPPEADRLERRLHPNVATSAHNLLTSIDRVVLSLKGNLQQIHDTYDFAFNSTRYTIMMGVREELRNIAKTNDMVYDVVMDISLLTKDIYMRAHRRGFTRPTTRTRPPDMPKFEPLTDSVDAATREQRSARTKRSEAQDMYDECQRQTSYLKQIQELLSDNSNKRALYDLRRHVNMSLSKLQAEFDTAMVVRKLGRHSLVSGGSAQKDVMDAESLIREARIALRSAAQTSRGNLIAYEDWKRRKSGDDYSLAPVSFTDIRSRPASHSDHGRRSRVKRATNDISPQEKARLRPIIDRAVRHASQLRDQANRIVGLLRPILRAAEDVAEGGNDRVSYRVQASLLADKLMKDVQNIRQILDRLRIAINDEDELRLRCEEIEMGSGDDGEATPIDCDDILDVGSGNGTDVTTPIDPDDDSDFVFEGEKIPPKQPGRTVKRFGDKLKIHIVQLRKTGDVTLIRAQTSRNKTQEMSKRWATSKANLDLADSFVTSATQFISDLNRERPNIDRISDRIKKVHEKVEFISNLTQSKTFQAVRKAERKVEEVRGGGGQGSGTTSNGGSGGNDNQDFAAAIEASGKAQRNMRSILTLTRVAPSLIAGVDQKINQMKSNISSLRSKVDKARLVLSSIQISINKKDEGYLPLPLASSDESLSLHTSVEMCIRPEVTDGPVLLVTGNNAESYGISMNSKKLKMRVYDKGGYEVGDVDSTIDLEAETWYNVLVERSGSKVSLSVRPEGGDVDPVEDTMKMALVQPPPLNAYIGGAPDNLPMSQGDKVWQGCIGGLRVNGQSVGLFQKSSESNVPVPCASHCSPSPASPSLVFEGGGYVQYPVSTAQLRHSIRSVYFEFRTRQENAFLISVVKRGFQLRCQLTDGVMLIETTTPSEAVVLRSSNSKYNDGLFHTLKIVYRDSTTYPEIDGKEFSIESTRPERIQSPAEGILIGGMQEEHSDRMGSKFSPLIGCMRKLQINGDTLTMSEVEKSEGVHIGSCSKHNMWLSCVEFVNTSSPIAYGTTEDAKTVVIVATRGSTGPILQYLKGDKFNVIVSLTKDGIDIQETVKSVDANLPFSSDDNNSFVAIKITDDSSDVKVEYLGQVASFSYAGAFSGWFGNGVESPYTITIGGQEEDSDMPLFTGGISQMTVGKQYLDMTKYIDDNKLSSCSRTDVTPSPTTGTVSGSSRRR